MTKIEKLNEVLSNIEALKDVVVTLQRDVIQEAAKDYNGILKSPKLSGHGKQLELESARQHYAEHFLKEMSDINKLYTKYVKQAKSIASDIMAEPATFEGTDSEKAQFERSVKDLQTRILLSPNPEKSAHQIEEFIKLNNSAFMAEYVLDKFNDMISPLVAADNNGKVKMSLTRAYAHLQSIAKTDDKVAAEHVLAMSETPKLVLTIPGAPSYDTLVDTLGKQAASNANTPDVHLDKMKSGKEVVSGFVHDIQDDE